MRAAEMGALRERLGGGPAFGSLGADALRFAIVVTAAASDAFLRARLAGAAGVVSGCSSVAATKRSNSDVVESSSSLSA
jgi:hypothetical protein